MGHSYTEYQGKNFLSSDHKVQTGLYLICREIKNIKSAPLWLQAAHEFWLNQAENAINGAIDPELDRILNDQEKANRLIEICKKIYKDLLSFGESIPASFLNELYKVKPGDTWFFAKDVKAEAYLKHVGALLNLLSNRQGGSLETI